MKTNKIDEIWNTEAARATLTPEVLGLVRTARRSMTRFKIRMVFFGMNISLATGLGVWALARGRTSFGEAWPAMLTLLVLWGTYVEFIRYRGMETRRFRQLTHDTQSALRWTLTQTRAASREIRLLLGVNLLLVIPLTVFSVQSLLADGKMTAQQSLGFGVFCLIVMGGNLLVLSLHLFRTLKPRARQLTDVLRELDQTDAA